MSTQIKFNYTSGGEFELSGSNYVGYFNVSEDGTVYTKRYFDDQSQELLTPQSVYSSDYYRSNNFRDRFVFDKLELPNSLDSILIQPMEIVNYSTINSKIELLHDNMIYLHSKMFMGSTDSPVDNNFYILSKKIQTDHLEWRRGTDAFEPLTASNTLSTFSQFDKLNRFVIIPMKSGLGYSIFGISSTHLIGLTSSNIDNVLSGAQIVYYSDVIDNNTEQKFIKLEDLAYDGDYLYLTDSTVNSGGQIYKYNINAFYTNDRVMENKLFLVDVIGGIGSSNRHNKFNGCTVLGVNPNELWVYDKGNKLIKVYDSNLVWLKSVGLPKTYQYEILDLKYRKLDKSTYGLFRNDTLSSFGLFKWNEDYKLEETIVFEDVLDPIADRKFNRLAISEQDSNVFYVTTDGTIYKKFFSRPEKTFAIFSRDKFYPDDSFVWDLISDTWDDVDKKWNLNSKFKFNLSVRDIVLIEDDSNVDNLFLLGGSAFYRLKESTNYETVLRDPNLKYYNFNSIKFNKKEYNQSFVGNKEFYKLFSNIIQFKNSLKGKFFYQFDKYAELVIRDYIYLTDDEISQLDIDLEFDSFINDNELVQPNVINRLLRKIYDFQSKVIELTEVKILNLKTSIEESNVLVID